MYQCYAHNWYSGHQLCPTCFPVTLGTTTESVDFTGSMAAKPIMAAPSSGVDWDDFMKKTSCRTFPNEISELRYRLDMAIAGLKHIKQETACDKGHEVAIRSQIRLTHGLACEFLKVADK